MSLRNLILFVALGLFAGCDGPPPEPVTALGIYDIDGAATCTVSPTGLPEEVFTIDGEVEILDPPSGHDEACERMLDLRIETCPSCPASPCRLCLSAVTDDEGAMTATLIADPELLGIAPACQLQDSTGEATTRLFVDGRAVSGSATTAEDGSGSVSVTLMGTTARGISGDNRPSTVACTIDIAR